MNNQSILEWWILEQDMELERKGACFVEHPFKNEFIKI
jgi:hypothetical protein